MTLYYSCTFQQLEQEDGNGLGKLSWNVAKGNLKVKSLTRDFIQLTSKWMWSVSVCFRHTYIELFVLHFKAIKMLSALHTWFTQVKVNTFSNQSHTYDFISVYIPKTLCIRRMSKSRNGKRDHSDTVIVHAKLFLFPLHKYSDMYILENCGAEMRQMSMDEFTYKHSKPCPHHTDSLLLPFSDI